MTTLIQDLRYGLRQWRNNPGFTVAAVLMLTLGIGLSAAMFSLIDAVILHPLPYPRPEQLVTLNQERIQKTGWHIEPGISAPNALDIQRENHVFQDVAYSLLAGARVGNADSKSFVLGAQVSPNILALLGIQPAVGRGFTPEEAQPGHDQAAILSYQLWQRQFGGKRETLGQVIQLNGKSFTVVGIMPQDFRFLRDLEVGVLTPLAFAPKDLSEPQRALRNLWTVARLKPGVTIEQARAEMNTLAAQLAEQHPEANKTWGIRVLSLHASYYEGSEEYLAVAFGAVFLVLLIACVNVASLLLARSTVRRREVTVRLAMGASRGRLMRQLLTESVLLALAGGIGGVAAATLFAAIVRYVPIPGMHWMGLNFDLLAFSLFLIVTTGVLFGLAPAVQSSKFSLSEALKEGGTVVTPEAGRRRLRNSLMACEVALAVVLMTAAGLLIHSFVKMLNVPLGFDPHNLLVTTVSMPDVKDVPASEKSAFFSHLAEEIRRLPAVKSVAFGAAAPEYYGAGSEQILIATEGLPRPEPGQEATVPLRPVGPGFAQALGVPLLAGRDFTAADDQSSTPVAIINQTMVKRFWPHTNPLGMHITVLSNVYDPKSATAGRVLEIVGVVGDYVTFDYLYKEKHSLVLVPFAQDAQASSALVIRSNPPPETLVPALRSIVRSVTKQQSTEAFFTWKQLMMRDGGLIMRSLPLPIVSTYALMAMMMTAVGIFGVVSYSVGQRTHEMAIRMSLGAQRKDVVRLVVGEGIGVVTVGVVIGLAGTLALGGLLASYLYGVTARDPITFAAVSCVMLGTATLAALAPARRATKVDPMVALRYE